MKELGYILVIGYLVFSLIVQLKINKSRLINKQQKTFNSLLLWLFPFVWGLIVLILLKPSQTVTITKEQRKVGKFNFTDNWEQLTGLGGASSYDQN